MSDLSKHGPGGLTACAVTVVGITGGRKGVAGGGLGRRRTAHFELF